jgi:hypothetical protein
MTPEQEQWLIQAIQELQAIQRELQASQKELQAAQRELRLVQQNQQVLIQELREGQAMLAQFFRESMDRFDERTRAIERRTGSAARKR